MKVLKVLNNSLILALDESGAECILMGKGLGYHKAIGYPVKKDEIQKIFVLTDNKMLKNFIQLASTIDETYLNMVREIIDFAARKYQIKVKDYLYLSLADHISFVVKRVKEGNIGENFNYPDVLLHHRNEYQVGLFAVNLINKKMHVSLPNSEATGIGLHFVDAEVDVEDQQKNREIADLVSSLEKIAQRIIGGKIDQNTFTYSRFLTHLNYFCERVYENKLFSDEDQEGLYQDLAAKMPKEVEIINAFDEFIRKKINLRITKQEKIYLIVHLHKVVEENCKKV
ncbi:PRD domain-containing protein [Lactobacillus sp. M0396]|uniref:PRD domain-containing protein n=1 Tax=Lactobacillus sp. M0396 TaxID=2751030 RepID=UPI0018DE75B0|nr:PRD domain-containing protein [Lactobacillus sp. M0396]MBI0033803.1 PRD domain-containing protein [Lactobacillus sp. M0396]